MRKFSVFAVFSLLCLFFGGSLKAQTNYQLNPGGNPPVTLCNSNPADDFYDDGGPISAGPSAYTPSFIDSIDFVSTYGQQGVIEVVFREFFINADDTLHVYSLGAGGTTLIKSLYGNEKSKQGPGFKYYSNPGDGALRFVLISSASTPKSPGWEAKIREASPKPIIDLVNLTVGTAINSGDSVYRVCQDATNLLTFDAIKSASSTTATYKNTGSSVSQTYTYDPGMEGTITYDWTSTTPGANNTATWAGLAHGQGSTLYTLSVTYGNCFVVDTTFRVNVSTTPDFTGTSPDQVLCVNQDVQVIGNATGAIGYNTDGSAGYSFAPAIVTNAWTDNGGGFSQQNGNVVRIPAPGTPAGTYVYTFTVTDNFGCTYTTDLNLTVNPEVNAGADAIDTACGDNNGYDLNTSMGPKDAGGVWHDLDNTGFLTDPNLGLYDAQAFMNVAPVSTTPKTVHLSYFVPGNPGCQSDSSFLTVTFFPEADAGTPRTIVACNTEKALDLIDSLGTQQTFGTWTFSPGNQGTLTFNRYLDLTTGGDPANNPSGAVDGGIFNWTYTVDNGVCPPDQALLKIDVKKRVIPGGDRTIDICSNMPVFRLRDSLATQADSVPGVLLTWTFAADGGVYGGSGVNKTFDPATPPQTTDGPFRAFYTGHESSGTCADSTATLTINYQRAPRSGTPVAAPADICTDATTYDLFNRLQGGTYSTTGTWTSSDPTILLSGSPNNQLVDLSTVFLTQTPVTRTVTFTYSVPSTNTICTSQTTDVVVNFTKGSYAGTDRTITVCETSPIFFVLDSVGNPLSPRNKYNTTISITGNGALAGTDVDRTFNPSPAAGTTAVITINDPRNGPACMAKTSTLTINVAKKAKAGLDNLTTGKVCESDANFDLKTLLNGNDPDPAGDDYWTLKGKGKNDAASIGWLAVDGIVDLQSVAPNFPGCGIYQFEYHAVSNNCEEDTAVFQLNIVCTPNPGTSIPDTIYVCNNYPPFFLKDSLQGEDLNGKFIDIDGSGGVPALNDHDAQFTPTDVKGTSKLYRVDYAVTNPPCAPSVSDTSHLFIYVSVAPKAGLGDTAFVCETDSTFDLYSGLTGHDKRGKFTIEMPAPWNPAINNEVNNLNPGTYFRGNDKNELNTPKLVEAFAAAGNDLFKNPAFPPYITLRYTVTDTNAYGPNAPLCPDSTVTLTVVISKQYSTPVASSLIETLVCKSDCNFPLDNLVTNKDYKPYALTYDKISWSYVPTLPAGSPADSSAVTIPDSVNARLAACSMAAGSYTLTMRINTPGCPSIDVSNIKLKVVDLPYAGVNGTDTICYTPGGPSFNVLLNTLTKNSSPVRSPDPGGTLSPSDPYFGVSVSGGTYTPSLSDGPGTKTITYTVGNAACPGTASAVATIYVKDKPFAGGNVTINACEGDILNLTTSLLNVDPAGTFTQTSGSPTIIAASTPYNPPAVTSTLNNPGSYMIDYTVNDGHCPPSVGHITINVAAKPNAGNDFIDTVCASNSPYNLAARVLANSATAAGTFVGMPTTNISGPNYYPSLEVPNNLYYIKHTVSAVGCPTDDATIGIYVEKVPNAGTDAFITVCVDTAVFDMRGKLNGSVDAGGVWTAVNPSNQPFINNGSDNRFFDPSVFGGVIANSPFAFNHVVKGYVCPADSATLTIAVQAKPKSGRADTTVTLCQGSGNYNLFDALGVENTDYQTANGSWNGGQPSSISTSVAPGTYTYVYTVTSTACDPSSTVVTVKISGKPDAGCDRDTTLCANGASVNLNNLIKCTGTIGGVFELQQPNMGTYAGGPIYIPSAGDNGKIRYIKSAPGCTNDTAFYSIKVNSPKTSFPDPKDTACVNSNPINLAPYFAGGTGTWSIAIQSGTDNYRALDKLVGNQFYANSTLGRAHIVLTYTDTVVGCPNAVSNLTLDIVGPGKDTTINACVLSNGINLSTVTDAQDIPGLWRITPPTPANVLVGNIFNPSVGTAGTTYTATLDGTGAPVGCAAKATLKITQKLGVSGLAITCSGGTYRVSFNITGGTPVYYVNGSAITGTSYNSAPIPYGGIYSFALSSDAHCNDTTIVGSTDCGDIDGDNVVDFLDKDDDNDGVPDVLEAGPGVADAHADHNGNGVPNYLDVVYCTSVGGVMRTGVCAKYDWDGDGIINQFDLDSDNDSISDLIEAFDPLNGVSFDGNPVNGHFELTGFMDNTPADGWHDLAFTQFSGANTYSSALTNLNYKRNGIPLFIQLDSDGDSIADYLESNQSINQLPARTGNFEWDFRHLDADNDSIYDYVEAGPRFGNIYTPVRSFNDGDGKRDFQDNDADNDGIYDGKDARVDTLTDTPEDFDNDGFANNIDVDSDDDNILDAVEAGKDKSQPVVSNPNVPTTPDYVNNDSDGDGIWDRYEGHIRQGISGLGDPLANIDGDTLPDYLDLNSDGDSLMDNLEGGPDAKLGNPPYDSDGDGIWDSRELDSDNDGMGDNYEARHQFTAPVDSDDDSTPDYRDQDSDNDCIPDAVEAICAKAGFAPGMDTAYSFMEDMKASLGLKLDSTYAPDYLTLDTDGDGLSDQVEAGSNCENPQDADGDGWPNFRDLDSDGDGIADRVEGGGDCDGDGLPNFADGSDNCDILTFVPDGFSPNGDGVNDLLVIAAINDFPKGVLKVFNRWGGLVFESAKYQNNWDGTYNNEPLPNGTYFYVLDLGIDSDKPQKGYIYINR